MLLCFLLSAHLLLADGSYIPLKDRVNNILKSSSVSSDMPTPQAAKSLPDTGQADSSEPEDTISITHEDFRADSIEGPPLELKSQKEAVSQPVSTQYVPLKKRVEAIIGYSTGPSSPTTESVEPPVEKNEEPPEEAPVLSVKPQEFEELGFELPSEPLKKRLEKILGRELPDTVVPEKYIRKPAAENKPEQQVESVASEKQDVTNSVPVGKADTAGHSVAETREVSAETRSSDSAAYPAGIYGVNALESGIRIESNNLLEGTPVESGRTLTLSYNVINMSGKDRNLVEEINLPEGFSLAFPPAEFSLAPMESYNSLLMINIPRSVPSGEHRIEYNVFDPDDQAVRGNLTFSFAIKSVTQLKFTIQEQPENVIGNQSFTLTGIIQNTGNATTSAKLKIVHNQTVKCKLTPSDLTLAAGESAAVTVEVSPVGKSFESAVSLRIAGENKEPGKKELINQTIYISTKPIASGKMDFTRRLPSFLSMNYFGDSRRSGTQYQFKASGALDASKSRQIDLFWRGKSTLENYSAYNQREQTSLTYRQGKNVFKLGEHAFSLSTLTGSAGSSRGFIADLSSGLSTNYGMIIYKSKNLAPSVEGSGFFVSHVLPDKTSLRLNHRIMTNTLRPGYPDESLTSLEVRVTPSPNTSVYAEFGQSKDGGKQGAEENAYRAELSMKLPANISVQMSRSDVGPDYGGGLSGAEINRTAVSVPVKKNLSANFNYSTYEQRPSTADNAQSVSQDKRSEMGLRYRITRTRDLAFTFSQTDRLDILNSLFDSRTNSSKITLSELWRGVRLGYTFDRSWTLNRIVDRENWTTNHQLTTSLIKGKVAINAYGGLTSHGANSGFVTSDSNNLGVSLNWEIIKDLMFRFSYRETFYQGSENRSSGDLVVSYRFPDSSSIELSFRNSYSWLATEGETDYRLTYSKFLGVPVGSDYSRGGIRGIVFDALASDTPPLPNVTVVIQSFAAITDREGRFMFANLLPGSYSLDIDRRSVGINKMASSMLPAVVSVEAGRVSRFDVGLVDGAVFKGQVSVTQAEEKTSQTQGAEMITSGLIPGKEFKKDSVANLIIEIAMGDSLLRRVTDLEGRFMFSGVQPGQYSYKLYDVNLPDGYKINNPEGTVNLVASEETEQNFSISPRIRRIIIIDED